MTTRIINSLAVVVLGLSAVLATGSDLTAPAVFSVTTNVLRTAEEVKPIGANEWGGCGAIEWAANNFVRNPGNEPVVWRNLHRVTACGPGWFEFTPGTGWFECWNSGFLSGADLRIYRLVDRDGKLVPPGENKLCPDMSAADHVEFVGHGRVIPEGMKGFPDGGWLASAYAPLYPFCQVSPRTRSVIDESGAEPGREYWYVVTALVANDRESDPSNEASATPLPRTNAPAVRGFKEGATVPGKSDTPEKPLPPVNLRAVAGPGCVTLSWDPSPSAKVAAYCVKRSTLPASKQVNRVYVTPDTPALAPLDYIVIERHFDPASPFNMSYVSPRIRGMGNPMFEPEWYWRCSDRAKLSFALEPYGKGPAPDSGDPGSSCLRITAAPGTHSVFQYAFVGARHGDAQWYGQLEPGKSYRMEAWLKQVGLAQDGKVTFSLGCGSQDVKHDFTVTANWARYTYDFTAGERPADVSHFGPQFQFTGPGTLWMDNARLFRYDRPGDLDKPYVPNATVLDELVRSQPATGRKGAHRICFLDRNATMDSITSWHASSKVIVNWQTTIEETMNMTLPMGLMFDAATGSTPQDRMRPWLILQHILHSEDDWRGLIEYLAAPYDPKHDTPRTKPWAYRRYIQRGTGTPWIDEFSEIIIEFGNETWHNGAFPDWLGFGPFNAIHQGGREYGLFTRYLCEEMRKSPYWKSARLDHRLRFSLGANYSTWIGEHGEVGGYGELAMQANPYASILGHANYVGPKWETGDYRHRQYGDEGVQECLVSYLTGSQANQLLMAKSHTALQAEHPYELAAYEGGPGGYSLPWSAQKEQVEIDENYGKSLAQGIGVLDCWLDSTRLGWGDQCYSAYKEGINWSSHTPLSEGFRPAPAWQALALRNRHASGALMGVETVSVPTFTHVGDPLPLVGVYALRDGATWSVFVLSRKLAGKHDGLDFGSGETPVTLNLPFKRARTCMLYSLSGDPRLTNRERLSVEPNSRTLPSDIVNEGHLTVNERSGGRPGGMPAGSAYLYVFEKCE